jgi:hypothetical protein
MRLLFRHEHQYFLPQIPDAIIHTLLNHRRSIRLIAVSPPCFTGDSTLGSGDAACYSAGFKIKEADRSLEGRMQP